MKFTHASLVLAVIAAGACGRGLVSTSTTPVAPMSHAGWQEAVRLGDGGDVLSDAYAGRYPPVVALASGPTSVMVAAWVHRGPNQVLASRFSVSGWEPPTPISSGEADEHDDPRLGVDAQGNAVAIWGEHLPASGWRTHANHYKNGVGWSRPQRIQPVPTDSRPTRGRGLGRTLDPKLVVDAAGNALAFWYQAEQLFQYDQVRSLSSARYTVAKGWAPPETVHDYAAIAHVAGAADGSAFTVWWDEGVWVATFDPWAGWATPLRLARNYAGHPDIAANAAGDAIAVWIGNWYFGGPVMASRFVGGRWARPEEAWPGAAFEPQVALNERGEAVAIWIDAQGLWASRGTPGQPWSEARRITGASAWPRAVAIDARGNVLVAWLERADSSRGVVATSIRAVRFEAGVGWGDAELLAQGDPPLAEISRPSLTFDPQGNAFVAWSEAWEKAVSVWVRRFSVPDRAFQDGTAQAQ